jgi:dTDP-4-dehydrorhamnose 3,5-epimerase-like enzyme
MKGCELIEFEHHDDYEGGLVALEQGKEIPFDIKRVYYIYGTIKDAVRGKHAHKALKQMIVCLAGSCDFILDDGKTREEITLNRPQQGLYIEECIWREFTNFSPDCVIMVIASLPYDESDYIRNYDDFLKLANSGAYDKN